MNESHSKNRTKVAIYGHSQIREFTKHPPPEFKLVNLKFFFLSGAKINDLKSTTVIEEIAEFSPELIILFIGGNDIVNGNSVDKIYNELVSLKIHIENLLQPFYGTYVFEIESRLKPKFISPAGYKCIKNSLNRKIKSKSQLKFLPLTKFGLVPELNIDGVHFNSMGLCILLNAIKVHIRDIIFGKSFDISKL